MAPRLPEQDERLADWVDGRLSARDRERLEAEFGVNPELRAAAERYRLGVAKIRGALQSPGETVDLSDKIMARLQGDSVQQSGHRPLFPILASAAAAAAILVTYIALQLVPVSEDALAPALRTKLAAGPEGADASGQPSSDLRMVRDLENEPAESSREVVRQLNVPTLNAPKRETLGQKKLAEARLPEELKASDKGALLGVIPDSFASQSSVVPQPIATTPGRDLAPAKDNVENEQQTSIEQLLRNALQAGAAAKDDRDRARTAGLAPRELVLVVEIPRVGLASLRADESAPKAARPMAPASESRSRGARKTRSQLPADAWREQAGRFMQQPLQQVQLQGRVAPPRVRGSYLDLAPFADMAAGKAGVGAETFAPLAADIYFEVAGDEKQILAYLRELNRITELARGQILSQWTRPGVTLGLSSRSGLSVPVQVVDKQGLAAMNRVGVASQNLFAKARKVQSTREQSSEPGDASTPRRLKVVLRQRR